MSSLTTFSLFPQLPLEIRNQIWAQTLPGPRVIQVVPVNQSGPFLAQDSPNTNQADEAQYTANPCSYGGQHPVALSVCQESRQEALRYLTPLFNAFWNLKTDYFFLEMQRRGSADCVMQWVCDMTVRGFLDGIQNIALGWSVWDTSGDECCIKTLRLLPNIKNCAFVFRIAPMDVIDVVDPGVAWELVPITYWCCERNFARVKAEKKLKDFLTDDRVVNGEKGSSGLLVPEITWNEISDRKFGDIPLIKTNRSNWRSLEPLGEDWFG